MATTKSVLAASGALAANALGQTGAIEALPDLQQAYLKCCLYWMKRLRDPMFGSWAARHKP